MLPSSGSERQNLSGVGGISGSGPSCESGPSGPASGDATPAGDIAMRNLSRELEDSVASLSEEYGCAEEELKKKSIRFSLHWEWRFKKFLESVAALDSSRADALQLLRADETDDTTRKLRRLDRATERHLQDLKEALTELPSVIADMKERANPSANLDSRPAISRESAASGPGRARSRSRDSRSRPSKERSRSRRRWRPRDSRGRCQPTWRANCGMQRSTSTRAGRNGTTI
jgi:hypothetical protein